MAVPTFVNIVQRPLARSTRQPPALRVCASLRASPMLASGRGRIEGPVTRVTAPAPGVLVRLYDRGSGRLVRETRAGTGGIYSFGSLDEQRRYYPVALDDQPGGLSAAIADYVQP